MKIPIEWLRSFVSTSLSDDAVADALTMAGLEVEENREGVFHTKVTPNRGDWMSIRGTARELATALRQPMPTVEPPALPAVAPASDYSVLVMDSRACPRYCALALHGLRNGPSPDWMQRRLTDAGMRPLGLAVDITNYVMLELGQPLHAFDLRAIPEGKILVRLSHEGESLRTLDGVDRTLPKGTLVICDRSQPIAVAGVMGGASTEVRDDTQTIVLESAHFDPGVVRRASKSLGLSTEASYRFERHVDPALTVQALSMASRLFQDLAGCRADSVLTDFYPDPQQNIRIPFRAARVNAVLGTSFEREHILENLRLAGVSCEREGDADVAIVPTYRSDIVQEVDLIEEVARVDGYGRLPESLPSVSVASAGDTADGKLAQALQALLCGFGMQEALTHSLAAESSFDPEGTSADRVEIRLSLSAELSGLRRSLVPNLVIALAHNTRQRIDDVALFEVGKVYWRAAAGDYRERRSVAGVVTGALSERSWMVSDSRNADYYAAKGIVEQLCASINLPAPAFVPSQRPGAHPARCADVVMQNRTVGYVAELDPDALRAEADVPANIGRVAAFELNASALQELLGAPARYQPAAKFPVIARDLAVVVDQTLSYAELHQAAAAAADPSLLHSLVVKSVYTGSQLPEGKKSVALGFRFQASDRTLTEADVELQLQHVRDALQVQVGAASR